MSRRSSKILAAFSNAFDLINQSNLFAAEQFAEAITYYLYHEKKSSTITSDEIHLMIQAILASTGYENAAIAFNEYHLVRKLKRKRIEVIGDHSEANMPWDKSRVSGDLVNNGIDKNVARAIASAVEEKILNMGINRIRKPLITQLVLADTEAMLNAQQQLQMISA
jgi:2-phosphoglycerate kinase